MGTFEIESGLFLHNVKATFIPISGNIENYDHYLSFDESNFWGIEAKNLKFVGKGELSIN